MKIYIATPVNARREATLAQKMEMAYLRAEKLKQKLKERYPDAMSYSSFDLTAFGISDLRNMRESEILGKCVQRVMECDAIFMDWGYEHSKGCTVEHTTALTYGKKIIHAYDLSIEPEKF